MTASSVYDPERETGFRLEQLAAAFDRVRHPRDWKGPIRAEIAVEERSLVEQAVRWFTGTKPAFESLPGERSRLIVTARGFREVFPEEEFHA